MREGPTRLFSDFASGSSLGAIMGSRSGRLAEAWPRRFCITRLVTVIRLTGAYEGWGIRISSCTNVRAGGIATYDGYSMAILRSRGWITN